MNRRSISIGCSGWYYRHWRGPVYPSELPATRWFDHYRETFDTVELNAPFYHWPRPATVQGWRRRVSPGFRYSVKANRRITHLKRFNETADLVRDFIGLTAALGDHLGCVLFQLPPGFRYEPARLTAIVAQLAPHRRCVIEFRHASWWNDEVCAAFREAGLIFCSVSAPNLPDDLVQTADAVYLRLHGAAAWYRHDYSEAELKAWAKKIRAARARESWVYFNNDFQGCAFRNAQTLQRLLR